MEDHLKRIAKNTEHKMLSQIIVSNDKTHFTTTFNPPIRLEYDRKYEIALVNLETYYSFPNIDMSNNAFIYSPDNGVSWVKILIPEGSYDLSDINDTVHQEMRKKGHFDLINDEYPIHISANTNTLKSILTIEDGYRVDFNHPNSISKVLGTFKVLGFTHVKYEAGFHESENVVNILSINSVFVNIDIISGSYVNGSTQNTIYSFFPNVAPGYKIIESPVNLVYLPITKYDIHDMEVKITDQNGTLLNLRGENLTIRFHIKEAQKNKKRIKNEYT